MMKIDIIVIGNAGYILIIIKFLKEQEKPA